MAIEEGVKYLKGKLGKSSSFEAAVVSSSALQCLLHMPCITLASVGGGPVAGADVHGQWRFAASLLCGAVDELDVVRESRGLDPTLLGNYFSRRDSLEAMGPEITRPLHHIAHLVIMPVSLDASAKQVFREFVCCLDFAGMNLVVALRKSRSRHDKACSKKRCCSHS